MKKSIRYLLSIAGLISLTIYSSDGQTRKELESQRMKIIKEIENTSEKLETTKKDKNKTLGQLKAIEDQISSRKQLIDNLQTEVKLNEELILENQSKLQDLEQKHKTLQEQYKQILRISYFKKIASSKWFYLLSADNLNQLIMRWRYIHQFDEYARHKLENIQSLSGDIKSKNDEISKIKEQNINAINSTSSNMTLIEKEQKEKDALIKKLTKEEDKLRKTLQAREMERERLNSAIEKIIIAELAKAKEKEKAVASAGKKKEVDDSGFEKNKGALEWPVSKGRITGKFGKHPHPSISGVEVANNGIDFTVPGSASVSCIFDGEIVGVTNIPGFKNMVIIKHGAFYTVYSKLESVSVEKGQKIKRGQSIGHIVPEDGNNSELHFELWKNKSKLNPEQWLNR